MATEAQHAAQDHGLWKPAKRLYYRLPPGARIKLRRTLLPAARALQCIDAAVRDLRVPLRLIRRDGLRTAFIGHRALHPYFSRCLFGEVIHPPPDGWLPRWGVRAALDGLATEADLVFLSLDRLHGAFSRLPDAWTLPAFLECSLPLPASEKTLMAAIRNRETRKDMNNIRRNGFAPAITHDPEAARFFYHRCHIPHIRKRHGATAAIISFDEFAHQLEEGELLLVMQGEQCVSGCLCQQIGDAYYTVCSGVRDGDENLLRDGALAAEYLFSLQRAHRLGCDRICFGKSRPFLNDGTLLFKKKWGASIVPARDDPRTISLRVNGLTPSVCRFLELNPMFVTEDERASALVCLGDHVTMTDGDLCAWLRHRTFPGCARIYLVLLNPAWAARKADVEKLLSEWSVPIRVIDRSSANALSPSGILAPR